MGRNRTHEFGNTRIKNSHSTTENISGVFAHPRPGADLGRIAARNYVNQERRLENIRQGAAALIGLRF
jgi:hypothetical protein